MMRWFWTIGLLLVCWSTLWAGNFRYNIGAEPETLDPGLITGSTEMMVVNALFEGLVAYDPVDLSPRPGLAQRWTISDDGLTFTFFLREAKWSDGRPLTSKDVLRSWERVLRPSTGAPYASQLYPVKGAEAYNKGEVKDFAQVGVQAPQPQRLVVSLEAPCPYFLDLCAFVTLFPVPLDLVEEHGDRWVRPEHIVGNGPFRIESWKTRDRIVMVPNEHYWDRETVGMDQLTAMLVDDQDTAYKLFLEGELDWINSVPLTKVEEASWHPDYYAMPYMGVYFYRFNAERPPFDDPRVRRALSMSVDRVTITRQVLKGGELPAAFFCPPVGGYSGKGGLPYDPERAAELLTEAGYPGGQGFPEAEIFYNTSEGHKKVAEAIQEQWKRSLSIQTRLRNTEWKIFLEEMKNLKFDICRSSWIGDYGDPNTFFSLFRTGDGNNRTGWGHPDYDRWLLQSQRTFEPEARFALFEKMERLLVEEEAIILPIYIYVNKGMISPDVEGWHPNVRDLHPFKHLRFRR